MSKKKLKTMKILTKSAISKDLSSFEKQLVRQLLKKEIDEEDLIIELVRKFGQAKALKKLVSLQKKVLEMEKDLADKLND